MIHAKRATQAAKKYVIPDSLAPWASSGNINLVNTRRRATAGDDQTYEFHRRIEQEQKGRREIRMDRLSSRFIERRLYKEST